MLKVITGQNNTAAYYVIPQNQRTVNSTVRYCYYTVDGVNEIMRCTLQ